MGAKCQSDDVALPARRFESQKSFNLDTSKFRGTFRVLKPKKNQKWFHCMQNSRWCGWELTCKQYGVAFVWITLKEKINATLH